MTEGEIQKAVFANLRKRGAAGIVFWHCPNDRASRKKAGFLPGASDVMVLHNGEFFALELKTDKEAASEEQLEFIDKINSGGGYAFCAKGLQTALACLEAWGLLRGRVA